MALRGCGCTRKRARCPEGREIYARWRLRIETMAPMLRVGGVSGRQLYESWVAQLRDYHRHVADSGDRRGLKRLT